MGSRSGVVAVSFLSAVVCGATCAAQILGGEPPPAAAAANSSAEHLAGLWGCECVFGPEVRGQLTITRAGADWHATIAGFEAPVRVDGQAVTFALTGNRGKFRGRLVQGGTGIRGHWIQPSADHVWGRSYATPVELVSTRDGVWRGPVAPLDDGEALYLSVRKQSDGKIGAFLRNPERNLGRFIGPRRVERRGDVVRLVSDTGGEELAGRYDAKNERLSILFPTEGATFDFTRRGRHDATGFYPRAETTPYVYRKPVPEEDGWETASLADVGLNDGPVAELVRHVLATETNDVRAPYAHALLVARHGKLVLEEYFYGFHKDRPHDVRSAGKTLASTLVGVALQRGASFGVKTPVYSLFPQYKTFANDGPRKRRVTVEHLLTMTSGYDGDDDEPSTPGNEDQIAEQRGKTPYQADWYKYVLDLPMAREPGAKGVYCGGNIHLLGGVVQTATGTWLPDLLHDEFALPLDVRHYHVNLAPLDNAYMAGGILMRPRDFMKMGQLFLNGGEWRGRRVVSKEWVREATRARTSINAKNDYGYAWWVRGYNLGEKTYRTFEAQGNGG